ncbi:hypothetical protein EV663_102117 [Rhodovulum bhavnagarense]|uniref:Flp pilus assembly pilin Flp n=1 Tax=Rhodovulum bhavnagarense TaxID=992286 RepID=A0A4R2RH26_9RHOB|nr:hypothetical protein [Rhodovulum bhavnagarense]TCP62273.1 hypothetical protein EV663_102117 [Rhodovulum bhavnagarense]
MKTDRIATFIRQEDGNTSLDWVVLSAGVIGLGVLVMSTFGTSTDGLGDDISSKMAGIGAGTN